MFYSLPCLPFLCCFLLIHISLFVRLAADLTFSAHLSPYFNAFVPLLLLLAVYQTIYMSTFTLSLQFLCSFSSVRRSVGCRRSRTEPRERWRMRSSGYSSSRSDTHTQGDLTHLVHSHTYSHAHAALISLC